MAAAVRVMLVHTMIAVPFSADGAASIERLEEKKSEKHAGGPQAGPVGPMATAPSGGVQKRISVPPGLGLGDVKLSRVEKRRRRNAARLRAFQEQSPRERRERRATHRAGRHPQQDGEHAGPAAEPRAAAELPEQRPPASQDRTYLDITAEEAAADADECVAAAAIGVMDVEVAAADAGRADGEVAQPPAAAHLDAHMADDRVEKR